MNIFIFVFVNILSFFLSLDSSHGAALVASKVFDEKAFGKLWERLPPPSKAAQAAKRKAHRERMRRHGRADGSGPAMDVSPERRRFHADLGGRNYAFEVDEKGGLRVFDPSEREVAYSSEALIRVNLDSPELRAAREQMRAYLQKNPVPITTVTFKAGSPVVSASAVVPQARPALGKATQVSGGSGGSGGRGSSGKRELGARGVSKFSTGDDASAVVAAIDLDRRLDEAFSDVMRTESIADDVLDEMFTPVNKLPDDVEQLISEMLDDSSRWRFGARSAKPRRAQLQVQEKARREVEAAYAALDRLGSQIRRVDGAERTRLQKQQQAEFAKLAQAITISPRHYKAMSPVEQKSLFYVATQMQIQGNAEKALRLLNSKGVTLDELGSYAKPQAYALLDLASEAGKHVEVAQAIRAHGFENDMLVNMLQTPGDLLAGSRKQGLSRIQEFSHYLHMVDAGRVQLFPKVIRQWLLMFTRNQDLVLDAYTGEQGYIRAFFQLLRMWNADNALIGSKQVSTKDKAMFGVLLTRLNVGGAETRRSALNYISKVKKDTPEFRKAASIFAKLPGVGDSEVLENAYDALYAAQLSTVTRKAWVSELPSRADGSNALTRLLASEGTAVGGAEVVYSPKVKLLRNLQLAEVAHKDGLPRDVLRYIEAVLETPDRELLYPGAKSRAYQLKMLAHSQQLENAVALKAPEAQVDHIFQEILKASRQVPSEIGITFEKELRLLESQVTWQIYKGDVAAATLSLWDAVTKNELGRKLSRDNSPRVRVFASKKGPWINLYNYLHKVQGVHLEKLRKLSRATRMDATSQGYLDTLVKHYNGEILFGKELLRVPSKYKADVLYSLAAFIEHTPQEAEGFIQRAKLILEMNPHPVLRDAIHLSLMETLAKTPDKALYYAQQVADSKVLPSQVKLSGQLSAASLRLHSAAPSPKAIKEARNILLTNIPKLEDPSKGLNYHSVISSYHYGTEDLLRIPRADLENLLAAYNHMIHGLSLFSSEADGIEKLVRLYRERARLVQSMFARGYDERTRVGHVANHPGIHFGTTLSDLFEADTSLARMLEEQP